MRREVKSSRHACEVGRRRTLISRWADGGEDRGLEEEDRGLSALYVGGGVSGGAREKASSHGLSSISPQSS